MNTINIEKEAYKTLVNEYSPGSKITRNCFRAFFVGGIICLVGQGIREILLSAEVSAENAGMLSACVLIVAAVFLTLTGLYSKLGKFAGAGSVIPITGFANAITAPAIEYKKEGLILGVGAKMFIIAGPVIVYGTMASVVVGIVYYFLKG